MSASSGAATRARANLYLFQPDPLPRLHGIETLSKGLPVRILREEKEFILVTNLTDVPKYKVVQGWIPRGVLKKVAG